MSGAEAAEGEWGTMSEGAWGAAAEWGMSEGIRDRPERRIGRRNSCRFHPWWAEESRSGTAGEQVGILVILISDRRSTLWGIC